LSLFYMLLKNEFETSVLAVIFGWRLAIQSL
jgi:hypothetical protein